MADLYDAAVAGAAPGPLTTAALRKLQLAAERVHLFALGKGAHAMATAAADEVLRSGAHLAGGVIVSPERLPSPHRAIVSLVGDHPVPGPHSFAAARELEARAAAVAPGDVAVVLLSGGATSLVAAPVRGFHERDLRELFERLHRSGLDIHAMNVIRKRFSRWGAGRLAVALARARVHVLVVSDVPGDDPADVASGPCTPDVTSAGDVLALLRECALGDALSSALHEVLTLVRRGDGPETPKPAHDAFRGVSTHVIGTNQLAVNAAVARARQLSRQAEPVRELLVGEAARCGSEIADALVERAQRGWRGCVVWGGETTVTRPANDDAPPGGRCQELALSAARRLTSCGSAARRVMLLAAGTDGRDGPTDAAGAFADASVWEAIARVGGEPERALAEHGSYRALDSVQALLRRGLTGTNVMDVVIGLVD